MGPWRREMLRFFHRSRPVVIEPVFVRLKTCDDRMSSCMEMCRRMLARRIIAAPNMTALRASAQVEPPAARGKTLYAAGAARGNRGVDALVVVCHHSYVPRRRAYINHPKRWRKRKRDAPNDVVHSCRRTREPHRYGNAAVPGSLAGTAL